MNPNDVAELASMTRNLKSACPILLFCSYHSVLIALYSTASCLIPIEGLSMLFEQSCY